MNYIVLSDRFLTTKKEHKCFACGRKFPTKTRMKYQKNICEGDFCSLYICETCNEIMLIVDLSEDGEYQEYCVANSMNQEGFSDPKKWLESLEAQEAVK